MIDDSVDEIISEESDFLVSPESKIEDCGEFYLEPNEWDEICQTDVNSKNILDSTVHNGYSDHGYSDILDIVIICCFRLYPQANPIQILLDIVISFIGYSDNLCTRTYWKIEF